MVDQSGPEKLEELLGDLQDEYGSVETLPGEVESLLQELRSGQDFLSRHHAAAALGRIGTEYPKVRSALRAASESDPHAAVRREAAQALRAWEEQERSRERAAQREAEIEAARKQHDATSMEPDRIVAAGSGRDPAVSGPNVELVQAPLTERIDQQPRKPAPPGKVLGLVGLKVETEGDTVRVSWRPATKHLLVAIVESLAGIALAITVLQGGRSALHVGLSCILAGATVYALVALLLSVTRITASPDEWVFSRGVLPLPVPMYYKPTTRFDPSMLRLVTVRQVVRKRPGRPTSPPVITYSLNAKLMDGSERELLWPVSGKRAAYLERLLTHLLREQVVHRAGG